MLALTTKEKQFLARNHHLTPVKNLTMEAVLVRDEYKDNYGDNVFYVLLMGERVQTLYHYFTTTYATIPQDWLTYPYF